MIIAAKEAEVLVKTKILQCNHVRTTWYYKNFSYSMGNTEYLHSLTFGYDKILHENIPKDISRVFSKLNLLFIRK